MFYRTHQQSSVFTACIRPAVVVFVALLIVHSPLSADEQAARPVEDNKTQTLVWPDGTRYVGEVRGGVRWGEGTIFWEDGTRFHGHYVAGRRQGTGTMILPDGTLYTGYFENDQLVNTPPDDKAAPIITLDKSPPVQGIVQITDHVKSELVETLSAWADSWSAQNVEAYLSFYSKDFQIPSRGCHGVVGKHSDVRALSVPKGSTSVCHLPDLPSPHPTSLKSRYVRSTTLTDSLTTRSR